MIYTHKSAKESQEIYVERKFQSLFSIWKSVVIENISDDQGLGMVAEEERGVVKKAQGVCDDTGAYWNGVTDWNN